MYFLQTPRTWGACSFDATPSVTSTSVNAHQIPVRRRASDGPRVNTTSDAPTPSRSNLPSHLDLQPEYLQAQQDQYNPDNHWETSTGKTSSGTRFRDGARYRVWGLHLLERLSPEHLGFQLCPLVSYANVCTSPLSSCPPAFLPFPVPELHIKP